MESLKENAKVILMLAVAVFAAGSYTLFLTGFFAPKFENVRRNTYENSQSYNDGMIQQLQSYYVEYQKADEAGKETIRSVISHQYANYPEERVPARLRPFLSSVLSPVNP